MVMDNPTRLPYLGLLAVLSVQVLTPAGSLRVENGVAYVDVEEQQLGLLKAFLECNSTRPDPALKGKLYCDHTFDGIACWPDTLAGSTAQLPCPDYVNRFKINEYAYKNCTELGKWSWSEVKNRTWTDYGACIAQEAPAVEDLMAAHMWNLRLIYNIGYGVSLVSILLALFIMLYFKKLHCPRNTIHINLFISFILRSVITFIKEGTFVDGVGLESDINRDVDGYAEFKEEGTHWQCKLIVVMWHYILGTNMMWIFVEGLYLHTLIFISVFSERSGIIWYIIIGWASPFLWVIPWIIVRAILENELCWNTHPTYGYYWIFKGPLLVSVLVNFILFLNIVRVLFTKLKASNTPEARKYRYKKLARSTLVLIPLFGVPHVIFAGVPEHINQTAELIKLCFEMTYNSWGGFVVAMLFCFLNGEVQSEVKKKWYRHNLNRGGSQPSQRGGGTLTSVVSSYVTRARNSLYSIHSTAGQPESIHLGNGSCGHHSNVTAKLSNGSTNGRNERPNSQNSSSINVKSDEEEAQKKDSSAPLL